jgi:hypothetical protein
MKLNLPIKKKFPPKLTSEELRIKTNDELDRKGCNNVLQAKTNRLTLDEIIKSEKNNLQYNQAAPKAMP